MMKCLYLEEHAVCMNFVPAGKEPAIKFIEMAKGTCITEQPGLGRIVILLKGNVNFSFSIFCDVTMSHDRMFFLPVGYESSFYANEDSCLVLIRLDNKIHFCESFRMEQLISFIRTNETIMKKSPAPCLLPVNAFIKNNIYQVKKISGAGYNCRIYFEKKIEELLMIMRFFYTKEQLSFFFKEIINAESHFAYKVVHNYNRFYTLTELAEFMGMTLHSFDRRFRKIFGQPGYKWMNEKRTQKIYHAITSNKENFKELAAQFGFSSPSAFNDYCKLYLGNTPGNIRKQVLNANLV